MKKKWVNGVMGIVLTVSIGAGMVACSTKETQSNNKQGSENAPVSQGKDSQKKEDESTTGESQKEDSATVGEGITYPLKGEKDLTIWCGQQIPLANEYNSWEQSPFHSGLYERTGVKVDYIYPAKGAEVSQSFNLLWTDKELPNIILHRFSRNQAQQYVDDEMIWDITEYLPKYAPNYWKYINLPENAAEKATASLDDGTFWSFPAIREKAESNTWVGHVIRQDWLDECNLKAPVTIADWEKVLSVFKEKYGATYGFNLSYAGSGSIASGFGALGFLSEGTFRVNDEGKIIFAPVTDETKAAVETFAQWFQKGYIDKDLLTLNDDGVRQKIANNEIGITLTKSSQYTAIMADAEANNTGATWMALSYPRTAPGEPTTEISTTQNRLTGYHAVITKSASEEELISALKWLDYAWTEEGCWYWNFGEKGVSYELNKEGEACITDLVKNDPLGLSNGNSKYRANGARPCLTMSTGLSDNATEAEKLSSKVSDVWYENTEAPKHRMPEFQMTVEDSERETEILTPLTTYAIEEGIKFFVCEKSISEYDAYIKRIYELGLQEVIDIYQKYYDAYIAR